MFTNWKVQILIGLGVLGLGLGSVIAQQREPSQRRAGYRCTGTVVDENGIPVAGATVSLDGRKHQAITDTKGVFQLEEIAGGPHTLEVSHLGSAPQVIPLQFKRQEDIEVNITLSADAHQLDEVWVSVKSVNRELAERPILTQVVDTRMAQQQPTTLTELLNRSAGVRVRQTGGLGASSNLMINGFQNRSIRYFKDGIPLDYLGGGFDISLVPVNMLERVEVYKGILPPTLGADALGGALNLVTNQQTGQQVNASYEVGSFNTHRVSLTAFTPFKDSSFFIGVDGFFNYSDNDYKADLEVADPESGRPYAVRVPLFHNAFKNYYAELYGGVAHTTWADELRIGLTAYQLDRQVNYGTSMSQAIGAATNRQHALVPTVRYRKGFWGDRLQVDQFLTTSVLQVDRVDTAGGQYNWLGEFTPTDGRIGELITRGSLASLNYRYYTSRSHAALRLDDRHTVDLNVVLSGFARTGSDPLGQRFANSGADVLAARARYNKQVVGLGLRSAFWGDRLTNQLVGKFYRYATDATDASYEGNAIEHAYSSSAFGVADGIKWDLTPTSYLRASVETALRLPEQDELFGDGDRKLANFELKPERSLNINLGYRKAFVRKHSLEVNAFYRITHDLILQVPYNFLFSQSQNIDQVRGLGVEVDGAVRFTPWLQALVNFTYQDQRLFDTENPSMELSRLRNTPFFFANATLNGTFHDVLGGRDQLRVYWSYGYVRQYYLNALPKDQEPDGFLGLWGDAKIDARNIIPDQHMHTVGFTYTPAIQNITLGVQVKNALDRAVYDNFRIQNPGRGVYVKLSYNFLNTN